jgi:hypothetical protein
VQNQATTVVQAANLRATAIRARRLALGLSEPAEVLRIRTYADELDAQAFELEVQVEPRAPPGVP